MLSQQNNPMRKPLQIASTVSPGYHASLRVARPAIECQQVDQPWNPSRLSTYRRLINSRAFHRDIRLLLPLPIISSRVCSAATRAPCMLISQNMLDVGIFKIGCAKNLAPAS